MADLERLEVQYDRKIQLSQFEPITVGGTATYRLSEDDDPEALFEEKQRSLQRMVERELVARVALKKLDDLGPSVPKIKAVIRDNTDVLDDDAVEAIATELASE